MEEEENGRADELCGLTSTSNMVSSSSSSTKGTSIIAGDDVDDEEEKDEMEGVVDVVVARAVAIACGEDQRVLNVRKNRGGAAVSPDEDEGVRDKEREGEEECAADDCEEEERWEGGLKERFLASATEGVLTDDENAGTEEEETGAKAEANGGTDLTTEEVAWTNTLAEAGRDGNGATVEAAQEEERKGREEEATGKWKEMERGGRRRRERRGRD